MSNLILKKLGHRLKEERIKHNLSQETLAQKAKVSRNFIGMIERSERNPTISVLDDIANAMNIETWELLRN